MKTIIISLMLMTGMRASSQSLSTDSLSIVIRTIQKQITVLQSQINDLSKVHNITFDPVAFNIVTKDSLNQSIYLKPILVDLTTVNNSITNLQNKIASLKAISTTTTVLQ